MLKQEYRLKKRYQFNYVYRVGRTCHGKFLLLVFSPSKNKNVKVGLSVSKKIGNSVQRNRVRRLLREAVKPLLESIKQDFNIIIVAKQSIGGKSLAEISVDLSQTLSKAELIK